MYVEGKLTKKNDALTGELKENLINNSTTFFFEGIRYDLADVEGNHVKKLCITSYMKNLLLINARGDLKCLTSGGYIIRNVDTSEYGDFIYCILLKMFLGVV